MEKSIKQTFSNTKFSTQTIKKAQDKFFDNRQGELSLTVERGDRTYNFRGGYENVENFFEIYRNEIHYANLVWRPDGSSYETTLFYMKFNDRSTTSVTVEGSNSTEIVNILDIFENAQSDSMEQFPDSYSKNEPKIYIGHGSSQIWRELKDHLSDQHSFDVIAYETGSRAGHTIRDILEEMSSEATIAFLIHTAEDKMKNDESQSRANVIHETGLFQGKLGFSKSIVLLEEGCKEFSNISGIQQIRFPRGKIRETFGDVIATIKREISQ